MYWCRRIWIDREPMYILMICIAVLCCYYSETCLERPLLWETTCIEGPHIPGRRSHISVWWNLSPKTTFLEKPYFLANWVVFQDRFYCIYTCFFLSSVNIYWVCLVVTSLSSDESEIYLQWLALSIVFEHIEHLLWNLNSGLYFVSCGLPEFSVQFSSRTTL